MIKTSPAQPEPPFSLIDFLPYLLTQAADVLSLEFQQHYKGKYGMLRTEWRVLFHLGIYGALTSKQICDMARLHKTKVSRAVTALEEKRFLVRNTVEEDRRHATLKLTKLGEKTFEDLQSDARQYDSDVRGTMTPDEAKVLHACLRRIADLPQP